MTVKQAAFLTSRIISLWFFYEAFSALVQVPAAFAMMSSLKALKDMPTLDSYSAGVFAQSASLALAGCAQVVLAIVFYRFGPRVMEFLTGGLAVEDVAREDSQSR